MGEFNMSEFLSALRFMSSTIMLVIGFIIVMILSFKNCKKHSLTKLSTLFIMICGYAGGIWFAALMADFYSFISEMYGGGDSRLAIFGVIVGLPFFLVFISLLLGKPWRDVTDLFAPGAILGLAFSKFGCFTFGCCPGIECSFGVYNRNFNAVMFPSQLCESITMCFVVAFAFWYNYKYKNKVRGTAYPITTMVYVVTRFCWEFLRYYDIDKMKHLLLGLSFWQLWCIVVFVGCIIWLKIMKIPKLPEYEKRYYKKHAEVVEKIKSKLPVKSKTVEVSVE